MRRGSGPLWMARGGLRGDADGCVVLCSVVERSVGGRRGGFWRRVLVVEVGTGLRLKEGVSPPLPPSNCQ